VDQYELRELHFSSLLRQKELEIQAQLAMLEQQRKASEMESTKSHQLTRQVTTFSQTETELRSQLNIYVEKFKQVWLSKVVLPIFHPPFCAVSSGFMLTIYPTGRRHAQQFE
jgi:hypothetical protein